MVVAFPCPGKTLVSGGSFASISSDFHISSGLAVGKDRFPMLPWKRVSPVIIIFSFGR